VAIVAFLAVPQGQASASHEPARGLGELVRQPRFAVAVIVGALGYAVMNFLMTATPLAMRFCGHPYDAAAGVLAQVACCFVALSGQAIVNFWWALVLLGVGWNFMYVGGTAMLTESYRPSEKAKAQGFNEITVFAVQAVSGFSSGYLVNAAGWNLLNYIALPLILVAGASLVWLKVTKAKP
jgi:MFS family permease